MLLTYPHQTEKGSKEPTRGVSVPHPVLRLAGQFVSLASSCPGNEGEKPGPKKAAVQPLSHDLLDDFFSFPM